MKSLLRRRPSPALVISSIALFVSLSGVSYGVATGFIDSREIKNNEVRSLDIRNNEVRTRDLRNNEIRGIDIRNSTIQGRDIGLNQVTGEDVREDTLQKVPSALMADTATSAARADVATALAGGTAFGKLAYAGEIGGGFVEVLRLGGLTLEARCLAGPELVVRANPAVAGSEIGAGGASGATVPVNDVNFSPGDNFEVTQSAEDGDALTIVFAGSTGAVVTVNALVSEQPDGVLGSTNDCGFFGTAQAG